MTTVRIKRVVVAVRRWLGGVLSVRRRPAWRSGSRPVRPYVRTYVRGTSVRSGTSPDSAPFPPGVPAVPRRR